MNKREVDDVTGIETTGHEWDGIKELDYPMPRWWLWTFYATIIFSIGYVIYYPAIPLIEDSTKGISGQTNRKSLQTEMVIAKAEKAQFEAQIAASDLETVRADEQLFRFAVAGGKSAFKVYCSQCHGSGAQGGPGYPNLNDDDWLWGGDLESIYTSIKHGIRNGEDDDARDSQMPAFGGDGILKRDEIRQVTQYILKLSNQEHDSALSSLGAEVFSDNCTACHGETGRGGRELGAPNLADAVSLYGNTTATIIAQLNNPKHGVMPAWQTRLSDETIKQLAVYVHSLGGGEKAIEE